MAPATTKASKKSLVVKLRLATEALRRFPVSSASPDSEIKRSDNDTPSAAQADEPALDKSSEDNSTPAPLNGEIAENKKKRPAPTGRKRAPPSIDPNAPMRERARPGPKKKPRLADGTIDRAGNGNAPAVAASVPAHKLGPKANTGAINAGLRALDRTGKPCRRWEKKGLQLKSFTGMAWNMPAWKGSQRPKLDADGEVKSDSSSDAKQPDSSIVASDKSATGAEPADTTMMNGIESSPAPPVAA